MKVQEKEKKKDNHVLKRIYRGREIIQKEFPFHPPFIIHHIHTRAHLDLIVWLALLFGSSFDFAINAIQAYLILHTLPWAPHIPSLEVGWRKASLMPWWGHKHIKQSEESNKELSKICFENVLKYPKLLYMRSRSDLIQNHSMPQLSKMVW
jgi:hypothetical protein